jgi:cytochrome b pre-mRNA-processing protein 3
MFGKAKKRNNNLIAVSLYGRCVSMARSPEYYTMFAIQDKLLGRFEVLALHLFLILRRLKEEASPQARDISQELCDLFVADMDHSLRDARLSESKIDKSFKRFVEGFYGRLVAYDTGIDEGSLGQAIFRNIYDNDPVQRETGKKLTDRVSGLLATLRQQSDITNLNFSWRG